MLPPQGYCDEYTTDGSFCDEDGDSVIQTNLVTLW